MPALQVIVALSVTTNNRQGNLVVHPQPSRLNCYFLLIIINYFYMAITAANPPYIIFVPNGIPCLS